MADALTTYTDPGPGVPFVWKRTDITIGIADLDAAAVTDTVSLEEYLQYTREIDVYDVQATLGAYFTGGSVSAAVLDVGKNGGDTDGYLDALNVFDTTTLGAPVGTRGVLLAGAASDEGYTASPNIEALFTFTGDNADQVDTGVVHIHVFYRELKL